MKLKLPPRLEKPTDNRPRFAFYYRTDVEKGSHQVWKLGCSRLTADLVEADAVGRLGAGLLGQLLNVSHLSGPEWAEFRRVARERDDEGQRAILGTLRRASTPGVDLDLDSRDDVDQVRIALDRFWADRGVELRWSHSSGPTSVHMHGEMGVADPEAEHVHLMRSAFAWWRKACKAIGLIQRATPQGNPGRAGTFWVFPEDPSGARGAVDLSPLNRDPEGRGSQFRPLGGMAHGGRKTLAAGSVEAGSPWTHELVQRGLGLWEEQEGVAAGAARAPRRQRTTRDPIEDLPNSSRLPRLEAWVASVWRPHFGHDLRNGLSDLLQRSGLVRDHWGIEALARGTRNRGDARDAWRSTARRIERNLPTAGFGHLIDSIGRAAIYDLAWALFEDLAERGSAVSFCSIYQRLGLVNRLRPEQIATAHAGAVLVDKTQPPPDLEGEELERWLARRQKVSDRMRKIGSRCGNMGWQTDTCNTCGKLGCVHKLHCQIGEACGLCSWRKATGPLAALELEADGPYQLTTATYSTHAMATAQVTNIIDCGGGQLQPTCIIGPVPGTTRWRLIAFGEMGEGFLTCAIRRVNMDEAGNYFTDGEDEIALDHRKGLTAAALKGWIGRGLLADHVHVRGLLEQGRVESFAAFMLHKYNLRTLRQGRNPVIEWPTQDEIKEKRGELAREAALASGESEEEDSCECPDELVPRWTRRYRLLDLARLTVIAGGLSAPPSYTKALELINEDERALGVALPATS